MTDADLPSFAALAAALRDAGSPADAAEAHGSLCGLACLLGDAAPRAWFAETLGVAPDAVPDDGALAALVRATGAALAAGDLSFSPLLPAESEPLAVRARGLAEWCHGFTHGLAAGAGPSAAVFGSAVVREVLGDFGELAGAAVAADEPPEEGESAYAELVEFVRVSVQLVFDELAPRRPAAPPVLH